MQQENFAEYKACIKRRSLPSFLLGLIPRTRIYIKFAFNRYIARKHGATIGAGVMIPRALAKKANRNLTIGDHSIVDTSDLDLRTTVKIGSHVVISSPTCRIITVSHDIDDPSWPAKYYGIEICDYAWLPVGITVLPSCRRIGYGAVVSTGSVVVKDVPDMVVVGGNPAKQIKDRKVVHSRHLMEASQTADLKYYWNAYFEK